MARKIVNPTSGTTDGDSLAKLYKINTDPTLDGLSDGVQAAYVFSPADWREEAEAAMQRLAQAGDVFTVDDLRRAGVPDPDKPQRWGALFAVKRRAGVIDLAGLELHRIAAGDIQAVRQWRGAASDLRRAA